jgi:hypothetical protein
MTADQATGDARGRLAGLQPTIPDGVSGQAVHVTQPGIDDLA